jgi:hypothetical protein
LTLVETLALQDIAHGRGMMLIGAHGDLAERVRTRRIRQARTAEVRLDTAKAGPFSASVQSTDGRPPAARAVRDIPLLKYRKRTIMAPLTTRNPGNVG